VILVTTKKGKEGKTKIEFNTSYSFQNVIEKLDLLETPDYLDYMEDARPGTYDPNGTYSNTNWQDEIYRNGGIQNYQVSLSGGNDNITYYVSGVVYDQEGIVIDSEYKRYSLTTNLDIQANRNLKVGINLFGARYLTNGTLTQEGSGGGTGTGVTSAAVLMEPTVPIYNTDGSYAISPIGDPHDNPVAIAKERTLDRVGETLQGNIYGEFKITKDLSLRSSLGVRMWSGRDGTYTPTTLNAGLQVTGEGYIDGSRNSDLVTEHYLTYTKQINDVHDLSIMGGYSYQSFHNESWRAISQNFITDAFIYWDLDGGSVAKNPSSSLTESELASVYGRVNYKLLDRYLLTVNARYDGSSRFAKNNKWAFFPSGAIAWNVADEPFMENVQQISQLKIRASYGVTGNQAIAPYQSLAKFRTIPSTIINNTLVNAVAPNAVANENLTWESTAQTNIGFDLGLFNHRIMLVADYYKMKTDDLLFSLALPEYSGYSSLLKNIGSVENKGFEITLSTVNLDGNVKWNTDLNFSRNRNKILELPDGNDIFVDSGPGHMVGIGNTQVLREGEPMGQFFGYIYDGVYQEGDDFLDGGGFEQEAGGEKFRDLTGDGQLTGDDRAVIGNPNPDFIWGFNNTLEYKGFDLNFFIYAMQGNDIYSFTLFELELLSGYANSTTRALYRWTPTNTNTDVPKATDSRSRISSSRFVYDGSFIRLKNVSLGYRLPKQLMDRWGLSYARIYVSGQNLLTFTDYPGVDPEVNWRGVGDSGGNINIGLDYGGYPAAKSYTVGIQVKF
jgi:TonB-linked SusC/RagA family outer membrane protein